MAEGMDGVTSGAEAGLPPAHPVTTQPYVTPHHYTSLKYFQVRTHHLWHLSAYQGAPSTGGEEDWSGSVQCGLPSKESRQSASCGS